MSAESESRGGLVRALTASDARMVLVTMAAIYLLFTVIQVLLQPPEFVGALASSLQRITFLTAIYAMLVLALNLHWGYSGLFNIGVAGFMAVGVYAMAILYNPPSATPPGIGVPFYVADAFAGLGLDGIGFFFGLVLTVLMGMGAAALIGAVAALPALRLRADYLAIVTVALSEIIRLSLLSRTLETFTLFANLDYRIGGIEFLPDVTIGTGAGRGISLPTNPVRAVFYNDPTDTEAGLTFVGEALFEFFGGFGIRQSVVVSWTYTLVLVLFVLGFYWLLVRVGNSPFGRVLKAIREDEDVAQALGKDTRWFKIKVFMLGCALMGLGGILFEGAKGFTDPTSTSFRPLQTFYIFIALIIGGSGSNTGSVLGGALFVAVLFEGPLQVVGLVGNFFDVSAQQAPATVANAFGALAGLDPAPLVAYAMNNISSLRFVLLGVVLIALIQRRPEGLLGHRKETAASVDLLQRDRKEAAADGGDPDE
jgi:branched-chain amino acid transport system permease protein